MISPLSSSSPTASATAFARVLLAFHLAAGALAQTPTRTMYLDFGPDDGANGNATASPDVNGRHWNNLTAPANATDVLALRDDGGAGTGFGVSPTEELRSNGLRHGGLTDPQAAELDDLAIATATQDYFFTAGAGGLRWTGLDPSRANAATVFGSRNTDETHVPRVTVLGASDASAELTTSGAGVGGGDYNGNRSGTATIGPLFPTPQGELTLTIERAEGALAYMNVVRLDEYAGAGVTPVESIRIAPAAIEANAATVRLEAEVTPADATFQSVTWAVENVAVAIVRPDGELVPRKNGAATVTATTTEPGNDISAEATVGIGGQDIATYFLDFGPASGPDGAATTSSAAGNTWINVTSTDGTPVALTNAAGVATEATVELTGMRAQGFRDGGLADPAALRLGELAEATATGDYFLTDPSFTGRMTLRGLDPDNVFRFFVYGGRDDASAAATRYTVRGADRSVGTLQTSGPDAGAGGATVNDDDVFVSELVRPTDAGEIVVQIQVAEGGFAYLNALQLVEHRNVGVCPVRDERKVVFMGSSVARGQGAPGDRGYAFQVGQLLEERESAGAPDYTYGNISVGGNRTTSLLSRYERDLLPECGGYVVYGLSLANEGVRNGGQAVYDQFRDNLDSLARRAEADGLQPVIVGNYSRGDYTAADYQFIKDINVEIAQWPYPSVNVLGALDDGGGRWPAGFQDDVGHPNLAGHTEFFYSFVPSLFDALEAGKPAPVRVASAGVRLDTTDGISAGSPGAMRSFTSAFEFSATGPIDLAFVAPIGNVPEPPDFAYAIDNWLSVRGDGRLRYVHTSGDSVVSAAPVADGAYHDVALTYYHASERIQLYLDGTLVGTLQGGFPTDPEFGGPAWNFAGDILEVDPSTRIRQWYLYRAGMNADEIALVAADSMLKSSLEVYAPLDGTAADVGVNLARSLTMVEGNLGRATALAEVGVSLPLKLYPNPARKVVTVDLPDAGEGYVVRVRSPTGGVVRSYATEGASGGGGVVQLDLAGLPDGVYVVEVVGEGRYVGRVVVAR